MTTSFIQWNVTAGSLLIFCGLIGLAVPMLLLFLQYGRTGSQALQVLQIRADTLDRELEDAREAKTDLQNRNAALVDSAHQAELAMKDRENEIAQLRARPDTQKMLETFEMNQTAVLKVLGDISAGLEKLLNRDHDSRRRD